jgi:hypothetical protein
LKRAPGLGHDGIMRLHPIPAAFAPLLFLLPSCVGAPDQAQRPAPRQVPPRAAPAPAPASAPAPLEWQYRPATPGNWTYRQEGQGSAALFTSPAAGPLLTLRCDPAAGRISLLRAGAGQAAMTLRTSYGAVNWPAAASPSGTIATRAASDAALDQIAYSRGRFAVEVQGLDTLIIPAWAEVGRVIEDCRR